MDLSAEFAIGPLTVIELTGKDRNKILNNLCTQDLRSILPGQVKETFLLDVKGRTISHGIVACLDNKTLFISSPGQAQRLLPHIDRYIIREDAIVRDASADFQAILLAPESPWSKEHCDHLLEGLDCNLLHHQSSIVVCLAIQWLGPNTKLLLISGTPDNPSIQTLLNRCQPSDCTHRTGWELQRIQNFWPWYSIDIDEKNLPQELAIDSRAISFTKGCYLGQETVARLDALGQVQKQLAIVELCFNTKQVFELPLELFVEGKSIGWLTSACKTNEHRETNEIWTGLAMLRRAYLEPHTQWQLDQIGTLRVCNSM